MRGHLKLLVGLGLFSSSACASILISTQEISRVDIHRGGVGAPATGPTEEDYVTWFHSWGVVKRVYFKD